MHMTTSTFGRAPAALPAQCKSAHHMVPGPQRPPVAAARTQRLETGISRSTLTREMSQSHSGRHTCQETRIPAATMLSRPERHFCAS